MFLKIFWIALIVELNFKNCWAFDCSGNAKTKLVELQQKLFCNNDYDETRPVKNNETVTKVNVVLHPMTITILEDAGLVKVQGYLFMTWKDERTVWIPSLYDDIKVLRGDPYDMWHPTLTTAENYAKTWYEFLDTINTYTIVDMKVSYTGIVNMKLLTTVHGPCEYDLSVWPYDAWNCKVTIGRRSHDDEMVVVSFTGQSGINLSSIKEDKTWQLMSLTDPAIDDLNNTEHLELRAIFKRRVNSFLATFILPEFGLFFIAGLPFCLGNQIGYRLVIHFLAIAVQVCCLQYACLSLKLTDSKGIIIFRFYLEVIFVCFFGIFVTVLNAKFIRHKVDPPKLVLDFICMLSQIPYIRPCLSSFVDNEKSFGRDTDNDECLIEPSNTYNKKWTIVFNFIDLCMFVGLLFFLIFKWFLW